jgi:hypothetical protein
MGFLALLPPILTVIRKMYCTCGNKNIGELCEVPIPHNYPRMDTAMKDMKWINSALESMNVMSEGNSVVSAQLKPFGPSGGYYSELALLTLTYALPDDPKNPPTDTIVKFLPVGFDKRLILDLVDLPKSECIMYYHVLRDHQRHGLPPLPIMSPKILYADYCTATNNAVMIMERITYTLGDQRKPDVLAQAQALAVCLAKIHAYFWSDSHPMRVLLTGPDNPICLIAALKIKMNIRKMLKMLKQDNDYSPSPAMAKALETTFPDGFYKMLQWCTKSPFTTICHGDARIDNVFFKEQDDGTLEAGLYDWAQAMVAPCFYEMSWALSHSFAVDFHTQHEEDLLKLYWENLQNFLGEQRAAHLSWDEFCQGYCVAQAVSISKCTIAFESIQKATKAADYPHKRKLVCDGMENALRVMERLDAVGCMKKIIDNFDEKKLDVGMGPSRRHSSFKGMPGSNAQGSSVVPVGH